MATIEKSVLLQNIDSEGNNRLLYPVTTLDNVAGSEQLLADLANTVRFVPQSLSDSEKEQGRQNLGIFRQLANYSVTTYMGGTDIRNLGITVSSNTGKFMRIGDTVFFTVFLRLDLPAGFTSSGGAVDISLPSLGNAKDAIPVSVGLHSTNITNGEAGVIWGGTSTVSLMTAGGINATLNSNSTTSTAIGYISINGMYELS